MFKRIFAILLFLMILAGTSLAETTMFVNNPIPTDRLHLRTEPNQASESLGKYYNGTEVIVLNQQQDWAYVRVGMGNASQTGWMMTKYLSLTAPDDAMPQYAVTEKMTAYQQPRQNSVSQTIAAGRMISVMGLIEKGAGDWWHLMVHTGTSEGSYFVFAPANSTRLKPLVSGHSTCVNVYISNPDPTDRLHLRTAPSLEAKSMGKYYNGCIGTLIGFAEKGEWAHVELYGRTGWMKSEFLCIEGKVNRAYYGIPTAQTTAEQTPVYLESDLSKDNYEAAIDKGTQMEVLGLVGNDMLHVRFDEYGYWFVYTKDTSFVDPQYSK